MKPEMWDDEAIGEVSRDARLLFCGLITQADDDGRLTANPRWIAAKVYPFDSVSDEEIQGWLAELHEADVLWLYEARGKSYIWLCGWDSNQSIDKRYYRESKLPGPPQERPSCARRDHDEATTQDVLGIGVDRSGGDRTSEIEISEAPLSELLAELIVDNGGKRPEIGKAWRDAERLLLERDERNPIEAESLIRWCQRDDFWRANVLSMPKFREKYDQLRLQAQRQRGTKPNRVAELVERGRRATA